MNKSSAEQIAANALLYVSETDDLMQVFLGSTGASVDDVKASASSPEFLGSVLDFLMMDDAWVVGFCDAHGLSYDMPMRARAALPGGEAMHWT